MPLTIGTRLGQYEVLTLLGVGGMGEVYRGRDTKLDRDVAIKVLPAAVAENATRRARFDREARVISQLSHPNICSIYDVGEQGDVAYLVMEYIGGETLEHRLRAGPLPWPTALQIATDIASAIAHAHEHGIVHRDLKPANVIQSGTTIKLLDFGIAKLIGDEDVTAEMRTTSLTGDHRIVGTPNYMAPEQHEGRRVDGRADIFALGAVLYEMLTGRKAFDGTSVASVTAAVIKTEPPPVSAPKASGATVPSGFEHVVRRALAKDPDDRWQTAQDLEQELRWLAEHPLQERAASRPIAWARRFATLAAAAAVVGIGTWTGWKLPGPLIVPVGAKEVTGFTIEAPEGTIFGSGMGKVSVSPDGTRIAFVALTNGRPSIWIRDLDSSEPRRVVETDNGQDPFWSPDGRFLGFYADEATSIKWVDLAGGPAHFVTQVRRESPIGHEIGACWMPDNSIVFPLSDALYRVSAEGGTAVPFIRNDASRNEQRLGSPFPIDTNRVFYRALSQPHDYESRVGGASGNPILLPSVKSNAMLAAGYVVFNNGPQLLAQPFDPRRLELTGQAIEIASVNNNPANLRGNFSASNDVLAYFPEAPKTLTWIDRYGHRFGHVGTPGRDNVASVARDGTERIVLQRIEPNAPGQGQVVIVDDHGSEMLLTHDLSAQTPVWSPDGQWVAYRKPVPAGASEVFELHRASPSGVGPDRLIARFDSQALLLDWSYDGRFLICTYKNDVWKVSLADGRTSQVTTSGNVDRAARLSNDGRWLAYTVIDNGERTVMVQRFPDGSTPARVPGHGYDPAWSPDGRELYYMTTGGSLVAVPMSVSAGTLPVFGSPAALFTISPLSASFNLHVFSVAPNGRFIVSETSPSSAHINVIINWAARLQR